VDWARKARQARRSPHLPDVLRWLVRRLGVRPEALEALGVGATYRSNGMCHQVVAAFPMRDGAGQVIGQATRSRDGKKRASSPVGLFYCKSTFFGGPPLTGPVLVPEGPSDTLACIDMRLPAVSRYMNHCRANVEQLAELFQRHPDAEPVIVAENDRKEDGRWPGFDGAERTAHELSARLGRPVKVALPPVGVKDTRAWLYARLAEGPTDRAALGVEYATLIQKDAFICRPPLSPPPQEPEAAPDPTPTPRPTPRGPADWYVPGCPTPGHPVQQHVEDYHRQRVLTVDCRRQTCPHCGFHARVRWALHLSNVIARCLGLVWMFNVTDEEWETVRKRLRRRGASHVSLRGPCGDRLVFSTTPPVRGRDGPLELGPAVELSGWEAARWAMREVENSPLECGADFIHTSRDWRPRFGAWKDREGSREWRNVGDIDDTSEVAATAGRDGITAVGPPEPCAGSGVARRPSDITARQEYRFPEEWDEARIHDWWGQFRFRVIDADEAAYDEPQPGDIDFPPPRPPSQPATTRLRRVNGGT
jgi:hypothetical protein